MMMYIYIYVYTYGFLSSRVSQPQVPPGSRPLPRLTHRVGPKAGASQPDLFPQARPFQMLTRLIAQPREHASTMEIRSESMLRIRSKTESGRRENNSAVKETTMFRTVSDEVTTDKHLVTRPLPKFRAIAAHAPAVHPTATRTTHVHHLNVNAITTSIRNTGLARQAQQRFRCPTCSGKTRLTRH